MKLRILEDVDEIVVQYFTVDSKQVKDSDGFWTDYTMYMRVETTKDKWLAFLKSPDSKKGKIPDDFDTSYVFIFGDSDYYEPEIDTPDYECETEEEAYEWFDNYNGFDEDEEDW